MEVCMRQILRLTVIVVLLAFVGHISAERSLAEIFVTESLNLVQTACQYNSKLSVFKAYLAVAPIAAGYCAYVAYQRSAERDAIEQKAIKKKVVRRKMVVR